MNNDFPTYSKRVTLQNAMYDDILSIGYVRDELYSLLEEMRIDKDGTPYYPDPCRVNRVICLCADALHSFLNDWSAVVGDTNYPTENYQLERARMLLDRNKLAHLVSQLDDKIRAASCQEVEDSLKDIREKAVNLPDADAIKLLEDAVGII